MSADQAAIGNVPERDSLRTLWLGLLACHSALLRFQRPFWFVMATVGACHDDASNDSGALMQIFRSYSLG
jgi:hypothetical protein